MDSCVGWRAMSEVERVYQSLNAQLKKLATEGDDLRAEVERLRSALSMFPSNPPWDEQQLTKWYTEHCFPALQEENNE